MDNKLITLYTKKSKETVVDFETENGFTVIRDYSEKTPYYKDGNKMFIKLAIVKDKLFYSVDMVKPEQRGLEISYIILDGGKYKNKVTNFMSEDKDSFSFDKSRNSIIYKIKNKSFTINEFIEILTKNHLSDRLYMKRKINNLVNLFLKLVFWLDDRHYEKVRVSLDKFKISREYEKPVVVVKNTDPFFKYFMISKNIIFSILILIFIVLTLIEIFPSLSFIKSIWIFGEFNLSNPFVLLFFFLIALICERLSAYINRNISDFFKKDDYSEKNKNFIDKLHEYQYKYSFKLKI